MAQLTSFSLPRVTDGQPLESLPLTTLQGFLGPRLSSPDGVFIFDETAAAKQGTHSVGVARQYSGTLGKVGNCQVGVYLAYASARGHAPDGQVGHAHSRVTG